MIWMGAHRGYLSDWVTQKWVQATGRRVDLEQDSWLSGPVGNPKGIGADFFHAFANANQLQARPTNDGGLIERFADLEAQGFDPRAVDQTVADFYEHTGQYGIDAWGEWCGLFRPFGRLLAVLFSRRLQQLNVPLSALDTSQGVTSQVLQLVDSAETVRYTAWVRKLIGTDNVLYAGAYMVCTVPRHANPCVKVVFPLPNGNAIVIMRATVAENGSLLLSSSGSGFGDSGFYFTVHSPDGRTWARYLRTFRETIHVYAGDDCLRTDHVLTIWRATFLRLHYRLTRNLGRTVEAKRPGTSLTE